MVDNNCCIIDTNMRAFNSFLSFPSTGYFVVSTVISSWKVVVWILPDSEVTVVAEYHVQDVDLFILKRQREPLPVPLPLTIEK